MTLLVPSKAQRKMAVRATFSAGVYLALVLALSGCRSESAPLAAAPLPVQAVSVSFTAAKDKHAYTGVIKPRYESDLGFRVSGKIVERLVNIGDRVTAGMPLARLDGTDYRLALESAEAEINAAESSLKKAEAAERRYAKLKADDWVSAAAYDEKKAAADEAQGRLDRAIRAQSLAKNQLDYTTLVAAEPGVVTALPVEAGQVVSAGQLIVRVARLEELEAVVAIPESRIDRDRTAGASLTLWADTGRVYEAKLREISPQADPVTRTYQARYSVLNPDAAIALGKTATVHLTMPGDGEHAQLPLAAVFKDEGQPSVWLIDEANGHVIKTGVDVSSWTETSAIISGGLAAGQKIVAAGVHKLDAASMVRVVEVVQ